MVQISAYVDGYNLYHAVKKFDEPHLKWVDLWKLCHRFVPARTGTLTAVHYFSAYAEWLPRPMARHKAYVSALESVGVTCHMASFKPKDRRCPSCRHGYVTHEEKETDVHLALALLDHARQGLYQRALIISRDSDLVPAARMTKAAFPDKELYVVAPPHSGHSNEMLKFVDGKHKIKKEHLTGSLLPESILLDDGTTIQRPTEYSLPV